MVSKKLLKHLSCLYKGIPCLSISRMWLLLRQKVVLRRRRATRQRESHTAENALHTATTVTPKRVEPVVRVLFFVTPVITALPIPTKRRGARTMYRRI